MDVDAITSALVRGFALAGDWRGEALAEEEEDEKRTRQTRVTRAARRRGRRMKEKAVRRRRSV